jgi:hypothetical protein
MNNWREIVIISTAVHLLMNIMPSVTTSVIDIVSGLDQSDILFVGFISVVTAELILGMSLVVQQARRS